MPNCKTCDFFKKCEDPIVGDFYCNYNPKTIEIFRYSHMEEIDCPQERDFSNERKQQPIPVIKPKMAEALKRVVPETPITTLSPNLIADPELKRQAEKLLEAQKELLEKIQADSKARKVTEFIDSEASVIDMLYMKFLNNDTTINNLINNNDFIRWCKNNKSSSSKENSMHKVLIGYLLGKYGDKRI